MSYVTTLTDPTPVAVSRIAELCDADRADARRAVYLIREIRPTVLDAHNRTMAAVDALIGRPPVRPAITELEYATHTAQLHARMDALQ